jgi:sec-independent protein translocase protein TatB
MFDIGFWELCIVGVVALLVFGPDKLPGVARSVGFWVGRTRRMITSVKQEFEQELRLQELHDSIKKNEQNSLHQFLDEAKTVANDLQQPLLPPSNQASTSPPPTSTTTNSTSQITEFR